MFESEDTMSKKKIRVVIDTNIWISFLIGKTLTSLADIIIDDKIQIIFSDEQFDELIDVIHRPKFQKYFSPEIIHEFISLFISKIEFVEITEHFQDCRDTKDNFLLDLIVSGKANYLVTGDKDLLVLNPFKGTQIIDYRSFQEIIDKEI